MRFRDGEDVICLSRVHEVWNRGPLRSYSYSSPDMDWLLHLASFLQAQTHWIQRIGIERHVDYLEAEHLDWIRTRSMTSDWDTTWHRCSICLDHLSFLRLLFPSADLYAVWHGVQGSDYNATWTTLARTWRGVSDDHTQYILNVPWSNLRQYWSAELVDQLRLVAQTYKGFDIGRVVCLDGAIDGDSKIT